ncbi:ABC transporter substrate-binding protein [Nitratireductor sp. ac15]
MVDGKYEFYPKLAESWSQVDARTWRFKVRPGVKFSNGEPLTAEAFAKTLEFWRAYPGGKSAATFANIDINVVDEMTFDVVTEKENLSSLPAQMTYFVVAPPRYHESLGEPAEAQVAFGNDPIGTGPYLLDEWQKGVVIKLKENPEYWGEKPTIKDIEIRSVSDPATRVSLLQSGAADVIGDIPVSLYDRIAAMDGKKMVGARSDVRVFLALNLSTAPTDNVLVRKAISYAIDRKLIIDRLLRGHAEETQGIFAPGELGYTADFSAYSYDPEKARALLKEAGFDGPVPITLNYPIGTFDIDQQLAEVIQAQLQEVGFEVAMKGGPNPSLQPLWRKPGSSEGIYLYQMSPVYPDSNFLMNTAYFGSGSVYRAFGTDEKLDEISHAAATAKEAEERQALYEKAQERAITELAMWVPLYIRELGYGMVEEFNWDPPASNRLNFSSVKFD